MTPAEFKRLPPLLRRAMLLKLGWSDDYVDQVRVELTDPNQSVPFGAVGYIRNITGRRTAKRARHGLYRKSDAAKILGPQWAD